MTTPITDVPMPYGVTVTSDGTAYAQVPANKKSKSEFGLLLTPGPCRVQASYAGPESVELRLYGMQGKVGRYGLKRILEAIPAGGLVLRLFISWARSLGIGCNSCGLQERSKLATLAPSKSGRSLSSSGSGGGLNDHTNPGHPIAVRDSLRASVGSERGEHQRFDANRNAVHHRAGHVHIDRLVRRGRQRAGATHQRCRTTNNCDHRAVWGSGHTTQVTTCGNHGDGHGKTSLRDRAATDCDGCRKLPRLHHRHSDASRHLTTILAGGASK